MAWKLKKKYSGISRVGGMPKDAKPFKGVGSRVIEIALKYDKEAYRCAQAVQLGEKIYVLHAFELMVFV